MKDRQVKVLVVVMTAKEGGNNLKTRLHEQRAELRSHRPNSESGPRKANEAVHRGCGADQLLPK